MFSDQARSSSPTNFLCPENFVSSIKQNKKSCPLKCILSSYLATGLPSTMPHAAQQVTNWT